jgi:protein-tyrosine kinase
MSGTLERVLKRAKQRSDGASQAKHPIDGSLPPKQPATATAAERQSAIQAMPAFQRAFYDPAECAKNRILVPDADGPSNASAAAAYRMLRTRLLQRARANEWTTIGVTSPGPGDGKSVTALNLALAAAKERNDNVFLLDLDMRSPRICEYLGVAPRREINEYVTGNVRAPDILFSVGIDNLTLAGTRTATSQASELLASGRVEELFAEIRGLAPRPLVLVDLPPLLSTDDALIVAPKVDACLLVLSEGRTKREGAAKALELLSEFKLAGIVLNRSRGAVADYYSP